MQLLFSKNAIIIVSVLNWLSLSLHDWLTNAFIFSRKTQMLIKTVIEIQNHHINQIDNVFQPWKNLNKSEHLEHDMKIDLNTLLMHIHVRIAKSPKITQIT